MSTRCALIPVLAAATAFAASASAQTVSTPFSGIMDTGTIGAASFVAKNPTWDGRGVAIAVLDTGVDMKVPGLVSGPDGKAKVVVARDFTGEATVECRPARTEHVENRTLWRVDAGFVEARDQPGDLTRVYLGFLDERHFRNSAVADINGNGRRDDRFAVAAFQASDGRWRAVVDTDGDGDMNDATVVGSYEEAFESVRFAGYDPASAVSPVSAALNIEQSGSDMVRVGFHMATAAHGTHVAGIAAGYRLNDMDGYNGVAPGAVILSLKIGDSTLPGGATVGDSMKKALEFAADWGRSHDMPVVVNMSYGVGSELEGHSDIDRFMDTFASKNPHVVVVTSAGNLGPGLSTVGTPGASSGVLAVAALYSPESASEILGAEAIRNTMVFAFSARGGELAKPDVAAPGVAASTVPMWAKGDVMSGTSMASPQVAGAAALMISALRASRPDAVWNSGMVQRALRSTARPLKGFGVLDFGSGVVDVNAAFRALDSAAATGKAAIVSAVKVETDVPTLRGRRGSALFWRTAGWVPKRTEPSRVRISTVFSSLADGNARSAMYHTFRLSAESPWVKLSRNSVYLRGEGDAFFDTWIDPAAVSKPGVHSSVIRGVSDSGIEFRLPVTVVTPWPVGLDGGAPAIVLKSVHVARGNVVRIPFMIPSGAVQTEVEVAASPGSTPMVKATVFDATGHAVPAVSGNVNPAEGQAVRGFMTADDVAQEGTFELTLAGSPAMEGRVDVTIRFNMFAAPPVRSFRIESGKTPEAWIDVVNGNSDLFAGTVEGRILGHEKRREFAVRGNGFVEGFSAGREFERVEIELETSAEDFARLTDLAVLVLDRDGRAVASTGFSGRRATVSVPVADQANSVDFRLEIKPALALGGREIRMTMRMRYFRRDKVELVGTVEGNRTVKLYPGVSTRVRIDAKTTPAALPDGAVWFGSVEFRDRRDNRVRLAVPVRAGSGG